MSLEKPSEWEKETAKASWEIEATHRSFSHKPRVLGHHFITVVSLATWAVWRDQECSSGARVKDQSITFVQVK